MVMKELLSRTAVLVLGTLSLFTASARAGESYFYQGTSAFEASFSLMGGQYTLYVYAKRPVSGYLTPASKSCIFGGNLQRLSPTHDVLSLGSGITISTIVPHKIGPAPVTMPAGLYRLYIAPLTDCDWHVILESTNQNSAGISPVRMLKSGKSGREFAETASLRDQVQFYAQYRTEHDAQAPVSGEMQLINAGKVVATFPLMLGQDDVSRATALYVDLRWDQDDAKYLGKNTVKFVVKIGSAEFVNSGEFTLTQ
jgi:hypothetical protein